MDGVLAAVSFFEPLDPLLELDESAELCPSSCPRLLSDEPPFSDVAAVDVDFREPRLSFL